MAGKSEIKVEREYIYLNRSANFAESKRNSLELATQYNFGWHTGFLPEKVTTLDSPQLSPRPFGFATKTILKPIEITEFKLCMHLQRKSSSGSSKY